MNFEQSGEKSIEPMEFATREDFDNWVKTSESGILPVVIAGEKHLVQGGEGTSLSPSATGPEGKTLEEMHPDLVAWLKN